MKSRRLTITTVVLGVVAAFAGLWFALLWMPSFREPIVPPPGKADYTDGATPNHPHLSVCEKHYPSGRLKLRQSFFRNDSGRELPHDRMQEWYEDGQLRLQGQWHQGAMDGEWAAWHSNGETWVHGSYQAGRPIGEWNYWDSQGKVYGHRTNGVKAGKWRERSEQLCVCAEGAYEDGQRNGLWVFTDLDGLPLLEIEFNAGMPDGKVVVHKSVRMEFRYDEGRELPAQRRFVSRGKTYSADDPQFMELTGRMSPPEITALRWFSVDGPFEPPCVEVRTERWPDGKIKTKIEGRLVTNGSRAVWIRHGKATSWHASGGIKDEQHFFDGLENGQFVRWHSNGKRRFAVEYQFGQTVGRWSFWYFNGNKQAEGIAEPGERFRAWEFWGPDGTVTPVTNVPERIKQLLDEAPRDSSVKLSNAQ